MNEEGPSIGVLDLNCREAMAAMAIPDTRKAVVINNGWQLLKCLLS